MGSDALHCCGWEDFLETSCGVVQRTCGCVQKTSLFPFALCGFVGLMKGKHGLDAVWFVSRLPEDWHGIRSNGCAIMDFLRLIKLCFLLYFSNFFLMLCRAVFKVGSIVLSLVQR